MMTSLEGVVVFGLFAGPLLWASAEAEQAAAGTEGYSWLMFAVWAAIILLGLVFVLGLRWLRLDREKRGMLFTSKWPDGSRAPSKPTGGEWGGPLSGLGWNREAK